jgi:hypothetical protein
MFSFLFLAFFGLGLHSPFFPCVKATRGCNGRYSAIAFCFAELAQSGSAHFPSMPRLGEELPTEEQQNCSATVK